jgi:hypothetical protein
MVSPLFALNSTEAVFLGDEFDPTVTLVPHGRREQWRGSLMLQPQETVPGWLVKVWITPWLLPRHPLQMSVVETGRVLETKAKQSIESDMRSPD